MSDNFLDERTLTPEQANALDKATEREPMPIKKRELPERSRSNGPTWYTNEYKNHYNFHLWPTSERMFACLCVTIVAIVAIIYW